MIASCDKVTEYISGLDEQAFFQHSMAQSAVIMQLQIIGEVAKKLSDKIQTDIDAPLKMIIGLRNIILHDYFMLELNSIWTIATKDIPSLEQKMHMYLHMQGTVYTPPFDDVSPLME